ncbi:hypothetical protein BTO05_06095 [Winogradskyella sp. PC-19]|uniref:hypothetical protein n=1 Tax=unclassified Winogradskyella TaxID=2615021 RepID=UPI000B3C3DA5|nr:MULTISPECIES: hypothetical protein [unclassified Winogradskyella]ARV09233.1 hypothetical protein BTO05_06095 [Winogradskyella sp. PC-19]RZN82450.1 MAG: hypothetical protein EVB12_02935 [Winogradskyella sp.]
MKIIYYLNKFTFYTTLLLYITLFLGLYSQIVLGVLQVISALILFLYWKKFNQKIKEQLYLYWLIAIIYGVCWLFDWKGFNDSFIMIFGIIILPMSIATYFFYILNKIKNIEL